jgi:SseB protein N-terminal domain
VRQTGRDADPARGRPGPAGGRVGLVPVSRPAGDDGGADPAVTAVLAAYAAGEAAELAVLTAVAASRLLVPVVAVLAEAAEDGTEKETEMALPTLIGNDGRKAVIAFTGAAAVSRWRADARPVPVPAAALWPAVAAEQADAVVIDVAGPVPLVIEGARLAALAAGGPPPAPHADPDVYAQVADVVSGPSGDPGFTLEPGGPEAELTVALTMADPAGARVVAQAVAARLAPRFRRGVAFRLG